MNRIFRRPSPAMAVALIALVWATCGNAIADGANAVIAKLKPNSVTSRTVKDGSLLLKDLKKSERAKLSLKAQADAAYLAKGGKAADAGKLGGLGAAQYTLGGGYVYERRAVIAAGSATAYLTPIENLGRIELSCTALSETDLIFRNTTSSTVQVNSVYMKAGSPTNVSQASIAAGETFKVYGEAGKGYQLTLQLHGAGPDAGTVARATILLTAVEEGDFGTDCVYHAHVHEATTGDMIYVPGGLPGPPMS